MVERVRRHPNPDDYRFTTHTKAKGLASNKHVFCPILKHYDCMCLICYNCEQGFNGLCPKFNEEIKANPLIIKELYRPIPELFKKDYDSKLIGCNGSIMSIGTKRDRRKKIFPLKGKFLLKIQFIPKYEKVELPYSEELFYKEGDKNPFKHCEVVHKCMSGDIIYTINIDSKELEMIKLMEKLI